MAQQLQKEKYAIIGSADEEVKQAKVLLMRILNNFITTSKESSEFSASLLLTTLAV